jgi:hypothetical protein
MAAKDQAEAATPIAEFRIYPGTKHGLYFTVQCFRLKREMVGWCRANCPDPIGFETTAVTHGFWREYIPPRRSRKRARVHREMGRLHFWKGRAGASVTAHEAGHAAVRYLERLQRTFQTDEGIHLGHEVTRSRGKAVVGGAEERLCHVIGNLNAQIVYGFYEHGVY